MKRARRRLLATLICAPLVLVFGAPAAQAASPAAFTTDSTGTAVNKNQYANKCDVYLNGGPTGAQLSAGNYTYFVLSPGGQSQPDGDHLLSTASTADRTFTSDGVSGTLINLCPYNDTANPGGVYILAICPEGNISPSACKYDAFKVKASPGLQGDDLRAEKTAGGAFTRTFSWQISKSVDRTYVGTNGNTATFNYTVTATKSTGVDSGRTVTGAVTVYNDNAVPVTGVSVSDAIPGATCIVSGGSATIAAADSATFNYSCTGLTSGTAGTNTATVTWDASSINSPNSSTIATAPFDFTAAPTLVNNCTNVSDTFGLQGTTGTTNTLGSNVCSTTEFKYPRTVNVPTSGCATYDNLARETASGTTAGASVTVCRTNANGFTIGYWSNRNGQKQIASNYAGLCTYLATFSNVLTGFPGTCNATTLPKYVLDTINSANSSGDGVAMYKAQFLATALNVYFSSALAGTSVVVPSSIFGTSCMTVANVLAYGNTNYATLKTDKAKLLAVKDVYDGINNNTQVTC